jgi:hypothetical protein
MAVKTSTAGEWQPVPDDAILPPGWATEDAGLEAEYDRGEGRPTDRAFEFTRLDDLGANLGNQWIVKAMVPKAGFGVIYGPPGSGKTAIAIDIGLHVAAGLLYRGRRTVRQPVVYTILEGHGGVTNRIVAARDRLQIQGAAFAVVKTTADFRDPANALAVATVARQISAGLTDPNPLIIIDTFQAALGPGGSDCDPRDVGSFIEGVKEHLVMANMTTLAVHHSGKDASRGARGWSGLNAAIDFELEVTRDDELRTMVVSKMRDADDSQDTFCYRLLPFVLGHDEFNETVTSVVVEHCADAGKGKGSRLSATARAALEKLWHIIKHGKAWRLAPDEAGGSLGPNVKCTTVGIWHNACVDEEPHISKAKNRGDRSVKFRKAMEDLEEAGKVTVDRDEQGEAKRCYPTPK